MEAGVSEPTFSTFKMLRKLLQAYYYISAEQNVSNQKEAK
jgi:hypothetical protein